MMWDMVAADSDVPFPPPAPRGPKPRYPWRTMEVGQSFLMIHINSMNTAKVKVSLHNRRFAPKRFAVRATPQGFRCWRMR